MIFQDRIHPQLRAWYDASAGFDFDHLETFVPQCNAAELANLKEDPAVSARDVMVPGPKNAPDVKVRIYTPNPRPSEPLPCLFFYPGCYHCFELSVPDAEPSKAAYEMMYAALRRAFGLE